MGPGARLAVVAWLAVAAAGAAVDKKFNITVGYLPSLTGNERDKQGLMISGALSLALEEINNSTEILPDVKILLEWRDTKSDAVTAMQAINELVASGAVAFFGPEGHCHSEAIFAQSRNLPMMSYKCSDHETSSLTNFVKIEPSGTEAVKSVISLLRYYRWNKFSIIYDVTWETVALSLENHAKTNNMTINHQRPFIDTFTCCEKKLTCCAPGTWYQLIKGTKDTTRIYVFLGSTNELINMMTAMESLQLFSKGEYMVIFVDMMAYEPKLGNYYLVLPDDYHKIQCDKYFEKRAQSLLVVVLSKTTDWNYQNFQNKVREYNKKEPFYFPEGLFSSILNVVEKFVSIYATYLYDSARMYATALDDLIKEDTQKEELSYDKLMRIVRNGTRIVERMIKRTPYKSVTGMPIRLDEHGDSEGIFSLLAYKPVPPGEINACSHNMIPVGHFQQNNRKYPEYKLNPRLPIDWAGSVKPEDKPSCGCNNAVRLQIMLTTIFFTLCSRMFGM